MKKQIFLISLLIILSIIPRLWEITAYPPIIIDEAANIRDINKIINSTVINPIDYEWGYGQAMIVHYPSAILVKLGLDGLFAIRLVSIIFSILCLIPFFFIVKKYTNTIVAFSSTILFSTSYYFLQFSRVGWTNIHPVFLGLYLLWILDYAITKKSTIHFLISGIIAGLIMYTYRSGEIYIIASFILIIVDFINKKRTNLSFKNIAIFFSIFTIVCLPWIYKILNNYELYNLRARVVSIQNVQLPYHDIYDKNEIFLYQILTVIKSWILLIPVNGGGIENPRYIPLDHAIINPTIVLFFFIGILLAFLKWRSVYIYLFIFISGLFFGQIMTVDPPNGSRGLIMLPIIYIFISFGIFYLYKKFEKYEISKFILILLTAIISLWDLYTYFNWMT